MYDCEEDGRRGEDYTPTHCAERFLNKKIGNSTFTPTGKAIFPVLEMSLASQPKKDCCPKT